MVLAVEAALNVVLSTRLSGFSKFVGWSVSAELGTFSLAAGVDVEENAEVSGFSGAMLVKPDPTLSLSSSESPP